MTIRTLDRQPARSSAYTLTSALLTGLFLFDQARFPFRRWPIALAICIVVTALAALFCRPFDMSSFRSRAVAVDDHLAVTIEMAANKAFCGAQLEHRWPGFRKNYSGKSRF